MNNLDKIIKYTHDYLVSVSPSQWYVVGSVVGGSTLLIGIVAYIKRKHLRHTEQRLESWFIQGNLVFWGLAVTLLGFIATNGTNISLLFPYLGIHAPQLILLATTLFSFSKGIKQWFVDRKASKKTIFDDIQQVIEAPTPTPTNVPVPAPTPPQPQHPDSTMLS